MQNHWSSRLHTFTNDKKIVLKKKKNNLQGSCRGGSNKRDISIDSVGFSRDRDSCAQHPTTVRHRPGEWRMRSAGCEQNGPRSIDRYARRTSAPGHTTAIQRNVTGTREGGQQLDEHVARAPDGSPLRNRRWDMATAVSCSSWLNVGCGCCCCCYRTIIAR